MLLKKMVIQTKKRLFQTSTEGSMTLIVNGNKTAYSWDGELSSAPRGFNLRANTSINGNKAQLDLKNKNLDELKKAVGSFTSKVPKTLRLKIPKASQIKKHLRRTRR
jgi:hypothetical protein